MICYKVWPILGYRPTYMSIACYWIKRQGKEKNVCWEKKNNSYPKLIWRAIRELNITPEVIFSFGWVSYFFFNSIPILSTKFFLWERLQSEKFLKLLLTVYSKLEFLLSIQSSELSLCVPKSENFLSLEPKRKSQLHFSHRWYRSESSLF